jgi:SpoIVB peptidase S55
MMTRIFLSLFLLAGVGGAQNFFPLKDVRPGMRGVGRTVFQGERVEEFQAEILGVLENLGPHQTIVLARLSGGPLAETGVLQGMSGSPVYIDGKLLGAVALGFPFSKEPIAGIQPIESMIADATFGGAGSKAILPERLAVSTGDLADLSIPLSFSGFSAATMAAYTTRFGNLGFRLQPGLAQTAAHSARIPSTNEILPGSMISVGLITGDMNMTADGTVTYVDGKRIYAFGHRFLDAGSVELPFAHSEVIVSIPTLNTSFKLSAPHEWVGAILSDRSTAVAGEIGRSPHTVPLTITVNSSSTGRHDYHMQVMPPNGALAPERFAYRAARSLKETCRR